MMNLKVSQLRLGFALPQCKIVFSAAKLSPPATESILVTMYMAHMHVGSSFSSWMILFLHVTVSALHDSLKRAEQFGPHCNPLPERPISCRRLHVKSSLQIHQIWNWLKSGKRKWSDHDVSNSFYLLFMPPPGPLHKKYKFVWRQINTVALNSRSSQSNMHAYTYTNI